MQETPSLTIGDVEDFVEARLPALLKRTALPGTTGNSRKSAKDNKQQLTDYGSESESDEEF